MNDTITLTIDQQIATWLKRRPIIGCSAAAREVGSSYTKLSKAAFRRGIKVPKLPAGMGKKTDGKSPRPQTRLKFTRHRTIEELRAQCESRGWKLDTAKFEGGSDYVSIAFKYDGVSGGCLVSTVNGRISGWLEDGRNFTSDDLTLDGQRWFRALLSTVYVK